MATPPKTTRLSSDVTNPQPPAAGHAPAHTYDPKERAPSGPADKAAAAADGHQTVNAVVPGDPVPTPTPPTGGVRVDTYTAYDNDNNPVEVSHDVDTGETEIVEDPEQG